MPTNQQGDAIGQIARIIRRGNHLRHFKRLQTQARRPPQRPLYGGMRQLMQSATQVRLAPLQRVVLVGQDARFR